MLALPSQMSDGFTGVGVGVVVPIQLDQNVHVSDGLRFRDGDAAGMVRQVALILADLPRVSRGDELC